MKLTHPLFLSVALCSFNSAALAQYSENFTGQNGKGVFAGTPATTDFTGVSWEITGDFTGLDGSDSFAVSDETLTGTDTDNLLTWESGQFSMGSDTSFQISLDIIADGDFEATDSIAIHYSIDGAGQQTAAEGTFLDVGGDGTFTLAGTQLSDSFKNVTTIVNTGAGTNMELFILILTNANTESFSFDNISVSAVPEPGTFALLAGCSALAFVMLRRRTA